MLFRGFTMGIKEFFGFGTIAPPDPVALTSWGWVNVAGVTVTRDEALTVSAVWSCCNYIANAIAPAPWRVFEVDSKGDARARRQRPDDPVAWMLNAQGNPECTAIAVREALLWSALSDDGNGYAEIEFDGAGRPVALWPMPASTVTPKRVDGELGYAVSAGGSSKWLPAWRVFHLKGPSLTGYVGESTITHASRAIGVAAAAQQFSASYFANGTALSGYLKVPGRIGKAAHEALRTSWTATYAGGPGASHGTPILEDGMEFVPMGADPDKSQLLATRQYSVEDICRFYGVPPIKAGVAAAAQGYGSNIEALGLQVVNDCLRPWAARLEQEADRKLFSQRIPWRQTSIDLGAHTRGDQKTHADALVVYRNAGVLSANEIREDLGMNTIPGDEGDVRLVPSGMVPAQRLLAEPAAAPATTRTDMEDAP